MEKKEAIDETPAIAVKISEVSESDKGPFVSASGKVVNSADLST
jgi:hypothetical protein